jgi:uncharacterized protein YndB with AHSA1/START domain
MHEWMTKQAEVVERRAVRTEWEGKPARVVVVVRSYPTGIADLWEAITQAERIKRWFMPVSGDLRLGGRFELQGNASGTINRCEAPELLAVTWEFGGNMSWVNVMLEAEGEGSTRLRLEHIAQEDEAGLKFWEQYGPGAVGVGWDLGLMGLFKHVESPGEPLPKEEELLTSPEGRALAATLSAGWREADVAFGTDAAGAKAAAERTRAFYTGTEPDIGG